jgi:hypothetical protein
MLNGSNDAVWRKEVPFGGLVSIKKRLGGQIPCKHLKLGPVKGNSSQNEKANNF